jgi:hypothetical protein
MPTVLLLPIAILTLSAYALHEAGNNLGLSNSLILLSPATAPFLWSVGLAACSIALLLCEVRRRLHQRSSTTDPLQKANSSIAKSSLVGKPQVSRRLSKGITIGLSAAYIIFLDQGILDYYSATSFFLLILLSTSLMLSAKTTQFSATKISLLVSGTTLGWLIFVYAVFESSLSISLPEAQTFSSIVLSDFVSLLW